MKLTLSKDFRRFIAVLFWMAYLAIFLLLINILNGNIALSNNDLVNNLSGLFTVACLYFIPSIILLSLLPKERRDFAYKLMLVVSALMIMFSDLNKLWPWYRDFSAIIADYKEMFATTGAGYPIMVLASMFASLSTYLLSFSFLEHHFRLDMKKPILAKKKVIIALVVILIVALLVSYGISLTPKVNMGWEL